MDEGAGRFNQMELKDLVLNEPYYIKYGGMYYKIIVRRKDENSTFIKVDFKSPYPPGRLNVEDTMINTAIDTIYSLVHTGGRRRRNKSKSRRKNRRTRRRV